jgi:hypothetical protein
MINHPDINPSENPAKNNEEKHGAIFQKLRGEVGGPICSEDAEAVADAEKGEPNFDRNIKVIIQK